MVVEYDLTMAPRFDRYDFERDYDRDLEREPHTHRRLTDDDHRERMMLAVGVAFVHVDDIEDSPETVRGDWMRDRQKDGEL